MTTSTKIRMSVADSTSLHAYLLARAQTPDDPAPPRRPDLGTCQDVVLRMALLAAAMDTGSDFTPEQRAWVEQRLASIAAFSSLERERVSIVLLAWARVRQPTCVAVLERQRTSAADSVTGELLR